MEVGEHVPPTADWSRDQGPTRLISPATPPIVLLDAGADGDPRRSPSSPSSEQAYDVGVWYALGLGGQVIMDQRGLDLVIVAKDVDEAGGVEVLWDVVRRALVARDPRFQGDEAAFCAAYDASEYAPDLR